MIFLGVVRPDSLGIVRLQVVHLGRTPLLEWDAHAESLLPFWHLLQRILRLPTR